MLDWVGLGWAVCPSPVFDERCWLVHLERLSRNLVQVHRLEKAAQQQQQQRKQTTVYCKSAVCVFNIANQEQVHKLESTLILKKTHEKMYHLHAQVLQLKNQSRHKKIAQMTGV